MADICCQDFTNFTQEMLLEPTIYDVFNFVVPGATCQPSGSARALTSGYIPSNSHIAFKFSFVLKKEWVSGKKGQKRTYKIAHVTCLFLASRTDLSMDTTGTVQWIHMVLIGRPVSL